MGDMFMERRGIDDNVVNIGWAEVFDTRTLQELSKNLTKFNRIHARFLQDLIRFMQEPYNI